MTSQSKSLSISLNTKFPRRSMMVKIIVFKAQITDPRPEPKLLPSERRLKRLDIAVASTSMTTLFGGPLQEGPPRIVQLPCAPRSPPPRLSRATTKAAYDQRSAKEPPTKTRTRRPLSYKGAFPSSTKSWPQSAPRAPHKTQLTDSTKARSRRRT